VQSALNELDAAISAFGDIDYGLVTSSATSTADYGSIT
jgi:hypothetical protein